MLVVLMSLWFQAPLAHALRNPDMSGDDAGAAVVYRFDETASGQSAIAQDTSGVGTPLNIVGSNAGNLQSSGNTGQLLTNTFLMNGMLIVNPKPNTSMNPDDGYTSAQRHRSFMVSQTAATKLNSCTSGLTVQAFVRPWFPFQGNQDGNQGNLIVGLSNSEGATAVQTPNFGLYQIGQNGSEAVAFRVRTGNGQLSSVSSAQAAFSSVREGESPGQWTEIIATHEPTGTLAVYINRIRRAATTRVTPNFLATAKLVLGNELVPLTTTTNAQGVVETQIGQQRNWSGEIAHVAIYCRGFSREEIQGARFQYMNKLEVVPPVANAGPITPLRQEARRMVERLAGVVTPIDHPMVLRVEQRLAQNDRLGAAKIITGDSASNEPGHSEFLNTTVKQMALRMSNREETIRTPLNDFAASFIGVTRDERSAKELLTEDFYYIGDPAKASVRANLFRDVVTTNQHYEDLERDNWDIGKVLIRRTGQQLALSNTGTLIANPDPAGVLTSRAFLSAHAIAGTNRRLVEYSFRSFACLHINELADTSASPARIGRDIDRLPAGDAVKFETSCKGCHTVMDGFRGAFAKWDFAMVSGLSVARHTSVNTPGTSFGFTTGNNGTMDQYGTVRKLNHNEGVFPNGYTTIDDSFVNNAVGRVNRTLFGWSGPNSAGGVGVNQFGRMISDSHRFAQCMAKRAFVAVCTPQGEVDSRITPEIDALAQKFKDSGYKFRSLFQEVAISPACAQAMGR